MYRFCKVLSLSLSLSFEKERERDDCEQQDIGPPTAKYEGWNFNSGNYLFTTDTK